MNTNRDVHTPYSTVLFRMILSDLGWLSKIFNDTKRRAVSLRQLSFLFSHWHHMSIFNLHFSFTSTQRALRYCDDKFRYLRFCVVLHTPCGFYFPHRRCSSTNYVWNLVFKTKIQIFKTARSYVYLSQLSTSGWLSDSWTDMPKGVFIATQLNSTQLTQLNSVQPSQSCFCLWRHDLQLGHYVHW